MSTSKPHELASLHCPACQGALTPTRLHCAPCDLSLEGRFSLSEFDRLDQDDLHFLRIFIHCEGSIREMESALGLSYPTIKSRLANLKKTLALEGETPTPVEAPRSSKDSFRNVNEVLSALEAGKITHGESVKLIKKLKKDPS